MFYIFVGHREHRQNIHGMFVAGVVTKKAIYLSVDPFKDKIKSTSVPSSGPSAAWSKPT